MNPTNPYSTFTYEQFAEWHTASLRIGHLTEELRAAREEVFALTAERDIQAANLRAELSDQSCALAALSEKHANQQQAARRNAAALVVTLRALEKVVQCFGPPAEDGGVTIDVDTLVTAVREAKEVLAVHGFPF